jgi:GST-like protein
MPNLSTLSHPNLTNTSTGAEAPFRRKHSMDLSTFGTPNGQKISILLEELGVPYNVKKIDITKREQKSPAYLKINPNGKIPALVDGETTVFETIAMMIYLADKYEKYLPKSGPKRYKVFEWCLFQATSLGPSLGQFGHFSVFAKEKVPHAIERFSHESSGALINKLGLR